MKKLILIGLFSLSLFSCTQEAISYNNPTEITQRESLGIALLDDAVDYINEQTSSTETEGTTIDCWTDLDIPAGYAVATLNGKHYLVTWQRDKNGKGHFTNCIEVTSSNPCRDLEKEGFAVNYPK